MTYKKRYNEAHYNYQCKEFPSVVNDGHYCPPDMPVISKSNGLTKFICNFMTWSGHHSERTNVMGIPTKKTMPKYNVMTGMVQQLDNGMEWRKSGATLGSSDVKGHINNPNYRFPIPVYIEVKIGKDKQSDDQKKYERKVTSTGALYCIVKTPDDFLLFYDYIVSLKDAQGT